LIFTGTDSLHFDIEFYADMITLTDKNEDDIFYMDTDCFKESHFMKLLPYVEASILRNHVTAKMHNGESLKESIQSFSYDKFYKSLKIPIPTEITSLTPSKLSDKSKQLIYDYMSSSYDDARNKYYGKVNKTENIVNKIRIDYYNTHVLHLSVNQIVHVMSLVAEALVYRAESYICAPSVMHIVRVMQSNPDKLNEKRYNVNYPKYCNIHSVYKKAFCNIGTYGYYMSILEQCGYLNRFELTYCMGKGKTDKDKCAKKIDKYGFRVTNAINILNKNYTSIAKKRCNKTRKLKLK
jgi:hypothetical protein